MKLQFLFSLYLTWVVSWSEAPELQHRFIIWNVGQGQWITEQERQRCRHYDFGGELNHFVAIEPKVMKLCGSKINELFLSHADRDHYVYLSLLSRRLKKLCWRVRPRDPKYQEPLRIPNCPSEKQSHGFEFTTFPFKPQHRQTIRIDDNCGARNRNRCSSIFTVGSFLLPGDSPSAIEKFWIGSLQDANDIKVLILGHHGSATSTGQALLQSLKGLHTAIASARSAVYNHPNKKVRARLKRRGLSVVQTEHWGNLVFNL